MPPALLGFDHVHIFVQDRTAAEAWYGQVLGFTRTKGLEFWAVGGGPLTLQDRSGSIHLALFERPREKNRATVALRVGGAELAQWRAHLNQVPGLKVAEENHEVSRSLYFSDPDGNPFEITTYEDVDSEDTE